MNVSAIKVSDFAASKIFQGGRKTYLKNKNGDAIGGNFSVGEGDFSRFLGYKSASQEEMSGDVKVSSDRVLELAMKKSFNKLGENAMQRGMAYRNMYISHGKYANKPGRSRDMIKDGIDAIKASVEMNQSSNTAYLEMQYKFQMASKSFGVISNLMKVRHESTKKAVSEVR